MVLLESLLSAFSLLAFTSRRSFHFEIIASSHRSFQFESDLKSPLCTKFLIHSNLPTDLYHRIPKHTHRMMELLHNGDPHRLRPPHIASIPNELVSEAIGYNGLILAIIFILLFFVRSYVLEGFLLKRIYGKTWTAMNEGTRRGFVNHHVRNMEVGTKSGDDCTSFHFLYPSRGVQNTGKDGHHYSFSYFIVPFQDQWLILTSTFR